MIKGWLVASAGVGLLFAICFIMLVVFNLVASSFCFYADELLVNEYFFDQH